MNLSNKKIEFDSEKVESAYKTACMYDINCIKPGNVNNELGHHDTNAKDFIISYETTSQIIVSPDLTLGERVIRCIANTNKITKKNTNLGIILLCSLFSQSLLLGSGLRLRESIEKAVMQSSEKDVSDICDAIMIAKPGGLGAHDSHDVKNKPAVSLYEIMSISSNYDQISNQYSNFFYDILNFIIPTIHQSIDKIGDTKLALSYSYLKTLEKYPDSHITRKYGHKSAKKTSKEASDLIKILDGDTRHESWGKNLMSLDKHLKMTRVNPGTTADLLVVSMMIYDYFIGIPSR